MKSFTLKYFTPANASDLACCFKAKLLSEIFSSLILGWILLEALEFLFSKARPLFLTYHVKAGKSSTPPYIHNIYNIYSIYDIYNTYNIYIIYIYTYTYTYTYTYIYIYLHTYYTYKQSKTRNWSSFPRWTCNGIFIPGWFVVFPDRLGTLGLLGDVGRNPSKPARWGSAWIHHRLGCFGGAESRSDCKLALQARGEGAGVTIC